MKGYAGFPSIPVIKIILKSTGKIENAN